MFARVHKRVRLVGNKSVEERVVALCDADLLGKVFEGDGLFLDLKSHRSFYEGEKVSKEQAVDLLRDADSANVVGKKSVDAAKKAFGSDSSVVFIAGVPHLQVYRV